ncbi:SAF domain-containing protein [Flavobacterium piscinae]|uniref:SAF domain-containing protein n=1 Tax=Flavobacterium piscinae TaxID=2506424 RepID=UPI002AAB7681|nr:SAF domain-containing protein [Flavobacterium piscinae]
MPQTLGNVFRTVSDEEEQKKSKFRRSIVLEKALKKGDIIKESDLAYKRPGTGIPPNEFLYVIGRKVNQDLEIDSVLNWNCFE